MGNRLNVIFIIEDTLETAKERKIFKMENVYPYLKKDIILGGKKKKSGEYADLWGF